MNNYEMNRRQALIAGGLGVLSMGMPGAVMGSDKLNSSGNAVASEKSCIFVLLCGGDPETLAGGDPDIAARILDNGRQLSDHYWAGRAVPTDASSN